MIRVIVPTTRSWPGRGTMTALVTSGSEGEAEGLMAAARQPRSPLPGSSSSGRPVRMVRRMG